MPPPPPYAPRYSRRDDAEREEGDSVTSMHWVGDIQGWYLDQGSLGRGPGVILSVTSGLARYPGLLLDPAPVHLLQLHSIVFVLAMHLIDQYYDNTSAWPLTQYDSQNVQSLLL